MLFHHNISSYPQTEEKLTSDLGIWGGKYLGGEVIYFISPADAFGESRFGAKTVVTNHPQLSSPFQIFILHQFPDVTHHVVPQMTCLAQLRQGGRGRDLLWGGRRGCKNYLNQHCFSEKNPRRTASCSIRWFRLFLLVVRRDWFQINEFIILW